MSFPPLGGMQAFMRAANIYGQQPDETLHAQVGPDMPPINQTPMSARPMNMPTSIPEQQPDEYLHAQVGDDENSILNAFKQSVLNPPQRQHMTYPKSTLNGLTEALKIAAEPSPLAANRVWVDGNAYQKQKVFTDPATGQKKFITNVHEPAFMDQVMRAMPAAVSGSTDILNQPYEDAKADYELKNKGLQQGAAAEAQMALANQRNATAAGMPQKYGAAADTASARLQDSATRARLADLKIKLQDLTDSQKMQLVLQNKLAIQDLQDIDAMDRVEAQQKGAGERNAATIKGAGERNAATNVAAGERNDATITGAGQRNDATIAGAEQRVHSTGAEARQTKATPSANAGATSQLPSQQKVGLQKKAEIYLNRNPDMRQYVTYTDQGFPMIDPNTPEDVQMDIYSNIYGGPQQDTNLPVDKPKAPGSPQMPAPIVPSASPAPAATKPAAPKEPTQAPPQGYVYIEDLNGKFVGEVKASDAQRLNTQKYRVRK